MASVRNIKCYEVSHVPAKIRNRDRRIGTREPVRRRKERISLEKKVIQVTDKPMAMFVCPDFPLPDDARIK
jgi:hypothetical protein